MQRFPTGLLVVSMAITMATSLAVAFVSGAADERFVHPTSPFSPGRAAPSAKVTNGTVFESGAIALTEVRTLVLPDNAVVEAYDGDTVRFFLTKSQHCAGHPPVPMPFDVSRRHFGIAQRLEGHTAIVSTFGEWANRGGSALIRTLVLVPRAMDYELREGLHLSLIHI